VRLASGGTAEDAAARQLPVVGAVVAAASVSPVVVGATPSGVAFKAVVPLVPHLVLALLVAGRIVATAACLSHRRYRDGTGEGENSQSLRGAQMHVGFLSWIACEPPRCRRRGLNFNWTLVA
jgi:hypothetical protein